MKIIFIIILFLISLNALADDPAVEPSVTADIVMTNTLNKMVYAYFGRDALLLMISDEAEAAVNAVSDAEMALLAAPFNSNVSVYVVYVLHAVYLFNLIYFSVKVSLLIYGSVWYAQRKGSAQLSPTEKKAMAFRAVIFGALALAPYNFTYQNAKTPLYVPSYVAAFFYLFGETSAQTDFASSEFTESQSKVINTVQIPRPENKSIAAGHLSEFFVCARLDRSRSDAGLEGAYSIPVSFYRGSEGLRARLVAGRCSIELSIGADDSMLTNAEFIESLHQNGFSVKRSDIEVSINNLYKSTFVEWLELSSKASGILSLPSRFQTEVSLDNVNEQFITRGFTKEVLSPTQLANWSDRCADVWALSAKEITERDRQIYHELSSRCISKMLNQKLVEPSAIRGFESAFKTGALSNRQMPLCADASDLARPMTSNTFSAWFGSPATGGIDPASCANRICSSSQLANGGAFLCSNLLSQIRGIYSSEMSKNRGVLLIGFAMFQQFTKPGVTAPSKSVYLGLNATPTDDVTPMIADGEPVFTVQANIPAYQGGSDAPNSGEVRSVLRQSQTSPDVYDWLHPQPSLDNWADEMLGQTRLFSCIKNPLTRTTGYSCGTVPQEFNLFGVNLLRSVIAVKSLVVMGDLMNRLQVNPAENGTFSNSGSLDFKRIATVASWVGAGVVADNIISGVFESGIGSTDDFGYWDQQRTREWSSFSNVLTGAMAVRAGSMASASGVVDALLSIGLVFGLVFAVFIPLFPLLLIFGALSKMIFVICRVVFQSGILLADGATDVKSNGLLGRSFDEVWMIWVAAFFKLPLMLVGLMLAYVLSNLMITHMSKQLEFSFGSLITVPGVVDSLVLMVMVLVILTVIYSTILSIIETFYDFTMDWLHGKMSSDLYSSRKGFSAADSKELLGVLVGR